MSRALIGFSGLVGSNLLNQQEFDACFRSTDIEEIRGQSFDEVYCAGVSAVKWQANKDPEADWHGIEALLGPLEKIKAKKFILISTVDVFREPKGVDETTIPVEEGLHPYGLHRLKVEQFIRERFPSVVVRLPGLFGTGLKKNIIFDLLNRHRLEELDSRCTFQFYNLERLSDDMRCAVSKGLDLVHFATEPVSVGQVAERILGEPFVQEVMDKPVSYDMQTCHASTWGREGRYLCSSDEVLKDIDQFARAFQKKAQAGS